MIVKNRITLIIVDCQYDFIDGSLAVSGAHTAINEILNFIKDNKEFIDKVVFTLDWHPYNHCSFNGFGGQWDPHCIAYSKGASIDDCIFSLVQGLRLPYDVTLKGTKEHKEEYGAFSIMPFKDCLFDYKHAIQINGEADLVVCGIAGDYCVKETLKNLKHLNPKVLLEGVVSMDDGVELHKFIKENNIETL